MKELFYRTSGKSYTTKSGMNEEKNNTHSNPKKKVEEERVMEQCF